jgi:hypothetical protein
MLLDVDEDVLLQFLDPADDDPADPGQVPSRGDDIPSHVRGDIFVIGEDET